MKCRCLKGASIDDHVLSAVSRLYGVPSCHDMTKLILIKHYFRRRSPFLERHPSLNPVPVSESVNLISSLVDDFALSQLGVIPRTCDPWTSSSIAHSYSSVESWVTCPTRSGLELSLIGFYTDSVRLPKRDLQSYLYPLAWSGSMRQLQASYAH